MKETFEFIHKNPGIVLGAGMVAGLVVYGLFKDRDTFTATRDGVSATNAGKVKQEVTGIKVAIGPANPAVKVDVTQESTQKITDQIVSNIEYKGSFSVKQTA